MKRYDDCIMQNSECRKCSLFNCGKDCHGSPADPLTYYRNLRNLSQQQLADASGIVRQQITRFETHERDIATAQAITVLCLARSLGVTMEDLICG